MPAIVTVAIGEPVLEIGPAPPYAASCDCECGGVVCRGWRVSYPDHDFVRRGAAAGGGCEEDVVRDVGDGTIGAGVGVPHGGRDCRDRRDALGREDEIGVCETLDVTAGGRLAAVNGERGGGGHGSHTNSHRPSSSSCAMLRWTRWRSPDPCIGTQKSQHLVPRGCCRLCSCWPWSRCPCGAERVSYVSTSGLLWERADYHWPQKSAARTAAAFKSRGAAMENFIVTEGAIDGESRISNRDPTLYATGNTEIRKYGNPERRNTVPGPAPSNVPNRGSGHVCKWA